MSLPRAVFLDALSLGLMELEALAEAHRAARARAGIAAGAAQLLLTPPMAWSSRQARQRLVATLAEHVQAYAAARV